MALRLYMIMPRLMVSRFPTPANPVPPPPTVDTIFTVCTKLPEHAAVGNTPVQHLPLSDAPDGRSILGACDVADYVIEFMDQGYNVLVHCIEGRNRSMLVAGFILHRLTRLTGDQVVDTLRTIRPRCLHNPAFERHLRSLP